MTQEEKELLLKDLCARLRCGVMVKAQYKDGEGWKTEDRKLKGIYDDGQVYIDCVYTNIENVKPYLRPMSTMTEEEEKSISKLLNREFYADDDFALVAEDDRHRIRLELCECYIDWLNTHHFDYRGLIEKGLALEAHEGMYK